MGYRRTPTAPLPPEVLKTLSAKHPVLRERDFLPDDSVPYNLRKKSKRRSGDAAVAFWKGKSKYGNKRVQVDGITFDSQAEARRYGELKLLEKAGQISCLKRQPRFPFYYQPAPRLTSELIFTYVADFSYVDNVPPHPMMVVEDVKGFRTPLYLLKKKLIEAQYGIAITEIPV
jgi:hypothetical protein